MELFGIHAKMDPAHAEPVGAHGGRQRAPADCILRIAVARLALELVNQRGKREQLGRMVRRQAIGGGRHCRRVGQVPGEVRRARRRMIAGGAQRGDGPVRHVDRLERIRIAPQPLRLFGQAEGDRIVPGDIGAPVHVVTDPAGEAERHGLQFGPAVGIGPARFAQHRGYDAVARILRIGQRGHGAFMLVAQRDFGRLGRALRIGFASRGDRGGHRLALPRGQQEGGVGGKHRMHVRAFPRGAEALEIIACRRQRGEPVVGLLRFEQIAEPHSPRIERLRFEFVDQPGQRVDPQLAAFELARNVERELEHGVEQRRLARLAVEHAQPVAQACQGRFDLRFGHHHSLCPALRRVPRETGRSVKRGAHR